MDQDQHADRTVRLLTLTEVARLLRVSKRTVYALVRSGRLPSIRVGVRGVRVLETDLARYLEDAREGADR